MKHPDASTAAGAPSRILVTGGSGFVGTALIARLVADGRFEVRGSIRRESSGLPIGAESVLVGELAADTNWQQALAGANTVVHLAARVHMMNEKAADPLVEFRRVNVAGTLNLARRAAAAGVHRFVFLSSVKVNGETGIYSETDHPEPKDAYGISKHEAELGLRQIAAGTGMEVVIIRPPLVYGPGVKANFQALMRVVLMGLPLPLGGVHNRRSLIALDNLVQFIVICIEHPAARNETFLISDGEDVSTGDLIRQMAHAAGRPARLIPVPESILMAAATLLGKRAAVRRLLGSLQVDISKARQVLGWVAPMSLEEGLRRTFPPRQGTR